MYKVNIILLIILIFTGCSVNRITKSESAELSSDINQDSLLKRVKMKNLSELSFYIQKADIQINDSKGKENVIASLRFQKPDKYLLSLRTKAGIELARLFISKDTLMMNDRLNRILYCGSPDYLLRKHGLSIDLIPVIVGDYCEGVLQADKKSLCKDDGISVSNINSGQKVNYMIDCRKEKTISTVLVNILNQTNISLEFERFYRESNFIWPGTVTITGLINFKEIVVNIRKVVIPWKGEIEFIPGNRYEIVELL